MPADLHTIRDACLAGALALAMLYLIGFAPGVLHNAAHDLRHSFAIPCH